MSHFTALVASRDLERTLEPFNEADEEYYQKVNELDYYAKRAKEKNVSIKKMLKECDIPVYDEGSEEAEDAESNQEQYAVANENGEIVGVYSFYNPNARWDWYDEDGGRWKNLFPFVGKKGDANSIAAKDVDIEAMFKKCEDEAREHYRAKIKEIGGRPVISIHWDDLIAKVDAGEIKIEEARETFWNQNEFVKKYGEIAEPFGEDVENFDCTEDEYVGSATLPFHSMVDDEGWCEKFKMGWWAMPLSEKKKAEEWKKQQRAFLEKAKAEAIEHDEEEGEPLMLYLVDCHI